jgi:hypothetical protein
MRWPCSALGDGDLRGLPVSVLGGRVQRTVEVALLDPIVIYEHGVGDADPGERFGDDAADAAEPDDTYPRPCDVGLRCVAPHADRGLLGQQWGRRRAQGWMEAEGQPIGTRDADDHGVVPVVGERGWPHIRALHVPSVPHVSPASGSCVRPATSDASRSRSAMSSSRLMSCQPGPRWECSSAIPQPSGTAARVRFHEMPRGRGAVDAGMCASTAVRTLRRAPARGGRW